MKKSSSFITRFFILLLLTALGFLFHRLYRNFKGDSIESEPGSSVRVQNRPRTLAEVLKLYQDKVDKVLGPAFQACKTAYPPGKLVLIGLKRERILQAWATRPLKSFSFLRL